LRRSAIARSSAVERASQSRQACKTMHDSLSDTHPMLVMG
jgi:hypothetical protein